MIGIYTITNIENGKFYVGSSVNIEMRWRFHKSELRRGIHKNAYLQHAWNAYGESVFVFAVRQYCSRDELLSREQYWLDTLQPYGERGYNLSRHADVANRGRPLTAEHKAKLSASKKGRSSPKKGSKLTPEQCAKLSLAHKGKKLSPEHIANVAAANKGKHNRPHSIEAKAAISKALKGRKHTKEHSQHIAGSLENAYLVTDPMGNTTPVKGLKKFCIDNGLNYSAMTMVISGRRNHHRRWTIKKL